MSEGYYWGKILVDNLPSLLQALGITGVTTLYAGLLAFAAGTVIGVFRESGVGPAKAFGAVYVEVFRNMPPLLYIFFFFFAFPVLGIKMSAFQAGVFGLGLYMSTYVAEAVRSGLRAVDPGQPLAARSLGLSYVQTLRHIVLPQAFLVALPPLTSAMISLVKGTALVGIIGVADLMYLADDLNSRTYRTMEVYTGVAVIYLLFLLPATRWVESMRRRYSFLG